KQLWPVEHVQWLKPSGPLAHCCAAHSASAVQRQCPLAHVPPSEQSALVVHTWPDGLSWYSGPPGSHSSPPSTTPFPHTETAAARRDHEPRMSAITTTTQIRLVAIPVPLPV